MIQGRFEAVSGRPVIEGKIILPRLEIEGDVSFLMDTGADSSVLMPGDAAKLRISYDLLEGSRECGGVGGTVHSFVEKVILAFSAWQRHHRPMADYLRSSRDGPACQAAFGGHHY